MSTLKETHINQLNTLFPNSTKKGEDLYNFLLIRTQYILDAHNKYKDKRISTESLIAIMSKEKYRLNNTLNSQDYFIDIKAKQHCLKTNNPIITYTDNNNKGILIIPKENK